MMDWTDRHCRYFHRLMTKHALLYTEMITADAILHGDHDYLLAHHAHEHPLALQLGGSDPEKLRGAVQIASPYGFDEFNLNVGCPSDRVKTGKFGACLMREPNLVRDCMLAIKETTQRDVSVKCRIGIDDMDDDEGLTNFVEIVQSVGIETFIIHARKAWLDGLSPKQNREVPPLNYQRVYDLKVAMPHLTIIINGGVDTIEQAQMHLEKIDGVMMGRAAYNTPYVLSDVDEKLFGLDAEFKSRDMIAHEMIGYIEDELSQGTRLHQITRHMLGLFHGQRGARLFRRVLSSEGTRDGAGIDVYKLALERMKEVGVFQSDRGENVF